MKTVHFVITWLAMSIMLVPGQTLAMSSTTLGSTDAQQCFEESRMALSMQGIRFCDAAISRGDLNRRDLAATYSNRGIIFANNGDFERAMSDHNKAINIKPDLSQAYINRGNVYYHQRDFSEALADYDTAIELETAPISTCLYNRGLVLLRMRRKEDALASFEEALLFAPDSPKIVRQIEQLQNP